MVRWRLVHSVPNRHECTRTRFGARDGAARRAPGARVRAAGPAGGRHSSKVPDPSPATTPSSLPPPRPAPKTSPPPLPGVSDLGG